MHKVLKNETTVFRNPPNTCFPDDHFFSSDYPAAPKWNMPVMPTKEVSIPLGWEVEVHEPEGGSSHGYYTVETLVHNVMDFSPGVVDYEEFKVRSVVLYRSHFAFLSGTQSLRDLNVILVLFASHVPAAKVIRIKVNILTIVCFIIPDPRRPVL